MITVDGRVLPIPSVLYDRSSMNPYRGQWNMAEKRFSIGAKIDAWTMFKIHYGNRDPMNGRSPGPIIDDLIAMMKKCGLTVGPMTQPPPPIIIQANQQEEHTAALGEMFEKAKAKNLKMVLVILPDNGQPLYSTVKYLGDVKYGLHTLCCVSSKFEKTDGRADYQANVAHKWNLKRGGVNQKIQPNLLDPISKGRTMLVGIDVTHPAPGSKKTAPSVAGVVASIDGVCGQFPASVSIQQSRKEMVTDLDTMIEQRLKLWQKHNKDFPDNIIVYRDGVSEGQYATLLNEEAPAIDRAIAKTYPAKKRPKIMIIVVGKRHHTRFYPTRAEDMDRSTNPQNGTVVDRGVTSEVLYDFFLQAHCGIQGTARPAHYVVLKDDLKWSVDKTQQLVSM